MTQFIVTRHGSNAANQPMTQSAIVGTVEGENQQAAERAAAEKFHCYNNQWLSMQDASECNAEDCQTAFEADQAHELDSAAWTD